MSERDARDRRVLTLLVQLFGRDVLDRLAGAGFDGPAAIARAGADRLAAEGGIPLVVARRLAAVVAESGGPEPATQPEPVTQPEPTGREERRPAKTASRKRAEPRTPAAKAAPAAPAAKTAFAFPAVPAAPDALAAPDAPAAPASASAPASPNAPAAPRASASPTAKAGAPPLRDNPDEGDPFVDDVALVSWLGLSSNRPEGRLAFTVSDSILDPVEGDGPRLAEGDAPQPAEDDGPRPPDGEGRRAADADGRRAAEARSEQPERPRLVAGSFWSFGRAPDPTLPSTGRKADRQPPAATPRRRKHDDH